MLELTATQNLYEELERLLLSATVANPIVISRQTLRTAVQRFLANEFGLSDLMAWANRLEGHDHVQYEPGFEKLIANVVFQIATPEINRSLNPNTCHELLNELSLKR